LLGIDSVETPAERRAATWSRLAGDLRPSELEALVEEEVPLAQVEGALERILRGGVRGRVLVRVG
jgi:NADPH:quinone reductase-like Zn-dependent oxidoreductase